MFVKIWMGDWLGQNDGVRVKDVYPLPDNTEDVQGIGLYAGWDWSLNTEIRITKLELFYQQPPYPDHFENPIDFEVSDNPLLYWDIDHPIIESIGGEFPMGVIIGDGYLPSTDWDGSRWYAGLEETEEQGRVLRVHGRGEQMPSFHLKLPEGKTFKDIKEISFKYKFDTDALVIYDDPWFDGWYGDYVMIAVNKYNLDPGDYYGDEDNGITNFQFSLYPAVYYSSAPGSSDNPELYDGYGQWAAFTMNADLFDADLGASDNARFNVGDGYTPDFEALKD